MFKNIKYILAGATAVLMLGSCQDFLDTPPVDSLPGEGYYTTPERVEQGIRGAYALMSGIELHHYFSFSEDRSDNVWVDPQANGIRISCESSYWRITENQAELEDLWAGWYKIISNVNNVLDGFDNVEFPGENGEAIKNQFKGELLFLRGFAHFELARSFANVPIVSIYYTTDNQDKANSLRQSTAAEVINNRAIVDLKEAEKLLPLPDAMRSWSGSLISKQGRVDRIGAKAMLARVYMTLKGFPFNDVSAKAEAVKYLDEVLQYSTENGNKYWAADINAWKSQFMTESSISNEYQIFAIQHTLSDGNKMSANGGMSLSDEFFEEQGNISGATNGGEMSPIYPEARIWYEYTRNNDPRGEGFAFINGYDEYKQTPAYGTMTTSFTTSDGSSFQAVENAINCKWIPYNSKREALGITFDNAALSKSPGGWPVNFPIIRLEDMMLLRAELYAEDGSVSEALELVNKIRRRAGIPERSTSDAAEAMEYIKLERQLEFYQEGIRWFDEVRYGEWEEKTKEKYNLYKRDGEYRTGVAPENVYGERYTLPIPFDELKAVPGLYEQNQDW